MIKKIFNKIPEKIKAFIGILILIGCLMLIGWGAVTWRNHHLDSFFPEGTDERIIDHAVLHQELASNKSKIMHIFNKD